MQLSHQARFSAYRDDSMLNRAEQYAKWTLPQLMVDLEQVAHSAGRVVVERDYQEMGALLTNNLSAKLAGLLFPTSRPFFRASFTEDLLKQALTKHSQTEIASALARIEMDACQQLFKNSSYNQLVLAAKHLIVTGNALTYRDSNTRRTITYGVNQYVVQRDGRGMLMEGILREYTYFDALPDNVQQQLLARNPSKYKRDLKQQTKRVTVALYTRVERTNSRRGNVVFKVTQEVDDVPIGETATYPEHLCPWQFLTWSLIAGEHYGRGLVEDYAGGFAKLSDQSEALALYGISAMKVVNMVASGSGTDVDTLANSETGEWVTGSPDTVAAFEAGDAKKIEVMGAQINETFGRLARAFMYSANTRDAERVTAYELRQNALEAENVLGGTYSSLSESWQGPLGHLLILEVNPGILQGLVTKQVKLDISAGIPALGRASDVQNLLSATQEAAAIVPQLLPLDKRLDIAKVMDLIYAGQSIDTSALFKSQQAIDAENAAEAQVAQGQREMAAAAGTLETTEAINAMQPTQ